MPAVLERLRRALAPEILVECELASGGMGIVFLARDTVLDRPIAIKVLRPELASAVAAERFLREGRAAARLSHPNVVRVHRAGIADGLHYFAMDLVAGETLADRLEREPLSAAGTAALGRDLLAALAAAHHAQLIHRDVKPSNVFLEDGRALLGDFGIARAVESDDTTLTGPGQPIGTLAYMAPEQLMGAPATARTDLYATGMVLFEACTRRGWNAMYAPEKAEWSDVPRRLRRPLQRALQPKPDDRWDTASSFAAALDRRRPWPLLLGVAAVLLAATGYLVRPEARPPNDVVVFPFATDRLADSSLGRDLTGMTRWYFERLPDFRVLPAKAAARAWAESPLSQGRRLAALTSTTRSRFGIWGTVHPRGPRLEVEIHVVNARGEPVLQAVEQGDSADRIGLADRVGGRIIGALSPELTPAYRSAPAARRPRRRARVPAR